MCAMGILRKLFGTELQTDVLDLLESQHKEVDSLIEKLQKGEGSRRAVFTELADKLAAHATVEERIFYPFVMSKDTKDMLQEAVEEHLAIKRLIADMLAIDPDADEFQAKLQVLQEQVAHHAHEEEEKELFPKVRDMFTREERAGIGNEVLALFEELLPTHPSRNVPAETASAAQLPSR
jgi:hemerythrin superfamily protein